MLNWLFIILIIQYSVAKGVKIFARGTWELEAELNCDDLSSEELVGVTAWSPDGTFLAAGTTKGQVLIWNARHLIQ